MQKLGLTVWFSYLYIIIKRQQPDSLLQVKMTKTVTQPKAATTPTSANSAKPAQVVTPTPVHQKPATIQAESKAPTVAPKPSLETAIEKALAKAAAVEKLEKLQDTRKNLQSFKVGNEGINTYIQITDNRGGDFSTSNTDLISTVLQASLKVVDTKIESVQAEILQD